MARVIGIIQVKGGAGRSTIATNLAGMLAEGHRVALVDCDMPQGTAASWAAIRLVNKPDSLTIATASNHVELVEKIKQLETEGYEYLVLDAPPRIAEMTRVALILSHLCLIPLGASAAEIWATSDLLKTIEEAKAIKPGVDARIAWTRFRGTTNSAKELAEAAQGELGLKELKARLGYRVAFSEALARGLTVAEWPERVARLEMQVFKDEVIKILEGKK